MVKNKLAVVICTTEAFKLLEEDLRSIGGKIPEVQIAYMQAPNENDVQAILRLGLEIVKKNKSRKNGSK